MRPLAQEVILDELTTEGRVVKLSQDVAAGLAGTGLVEVRPEGAAQWRLLPRGRVGAVSVDGLQVQVTPKEKVGLSRLLFLLGYARDPGFRSEDVTGSEDRDIWPALAESLARQAEAALSRGVMQGYRTVDDQLRTVRGRIRIGDQIARRPGSMMPLEVSYDEYTVDIAENRILRSAVRRLLSVPRVTTQARARLAHLDGRMDGAGVLRPGAPLPVWQPTRLNGRYHPALRLAELVLRNTSAEAGPGGVQVAAFVVQMWQVFEDFVGTALTETLRRYPGTTQTSPQYRDHLDVPPLGKVRGEVPMALDVVHLVRRRPRLIFDAKYKVADATGRYPNADHYQMLAYCTALQVPVAWLVYAQGSQTPVVRRVRNTDVTIVEYPLDLRDEPRLLLKQIDRLADHAWAEDLPGLEPVVARDDAAQSHHVGLAR